MGDRKQSPLEILAHRQKNQFYGFLAAFAVCAIGLLIVGVLLGVLNAQNVKYITGVGPDGGGEITLLAGLGELIVTDVPNHDITLVNTGVVTVNDLNADAGGNLIINVTQPGLNISNSGNTVLLTNDGVTSVIADIGIEIGDGPTGDITVKNTGLITANNLVPDVAGNMVFAAGEAIGVTSVGNTITYTNEGVTSIVAGDGISVNASTGHITITNTGVVTINSLASVLGNIVVDATDGLAASSTGNTVTLTDVLTTQTALDNTNSQGPLVDYTAFIGFFTPVPEETWRTGVTPGFPSPFIPGSFDDGQGNIGNDFWVIPSIGTYTINTDCEVIPSGIATDDHQSVSVALCFGANSEDPLAAGTIPIGAYATLDISGGTNGGASPVLDRRLSFSTTFQAGCSNCLTQVGQALSVHARLDHTGVLPGTFTADFVCRMQVARIK
jgi:hypothetical protein